MMPRHVLIPLLGAALLLVACEREERDTKPRPPASELGSNVRLSELQPGMPKGGKPTRNDAEDKAYDVAQGQRLYRAYNCNGCHANGGGGIGPPLMDDVWIYGSDPANVAATILEGRPNGMPSFRGKIPDYQLWELAAYVRSMSGLAPKDAAPNRDDHMSGPPPESATVQQHPKNVGPGAIR
jgi:cytochrome c oxidase cbb3-type subunit 3